MSTTGMRTETFGERLERLADRCGVGMSQLAEALGMNRTTFYKWRRMERLPTQIGILVAAADLFGVSVDELIGREGVGVEVTVEADGGSPEAVQLRITAPDPAPHPETVSLATEDPAATPAGVPLRPRPVTISGSPQPPTIATTMREARLTDATPANRPASPARCLCWVARQANGDLRRIPVGDCPVHGKGSGPC